MGDRIIAEPDRLEGYVQSVRAACGQVSVEDHGHAIRAYQQAEPNDLRSVASADLSEQVEQTRQGLLALADGAEAFAWALRQLDEPGPPGHPTAMVGSTTTADGLLALLVELRLQMPEASDRQVLQAAGSRQARLVEQAMQAGDHQLVAERLAPLDEYGTDPAFAGGFVAALGGHGIRDVLQTLGQAGNVTSARHVADTFFVGMQAMSAEDAESVMLELSGADVGVLAAVGEVVPSTPVAARLVGIGPMPFMHSMSNAQVALLEPVVPDEHPQPTLDGHVRAKAFDDMLAHRAGFDTIAGVVGGGRHSTELGNALTNHLMAHPEAIDPIVNHAEGHGEAEGHELHLLMGAVAAGDDATGMVAAYAAHRIDLALAPGTTETVGGLNDAGWAIGRMHAGLAAVDATLQVNLVGAAIDAGLIAGSRLPPTALPATVGGAVRAVQSNVGVSDVLTLEDISARVVENRRNDVHALDLLTAGKPNREQVVEDLGLTLTEDNALVVDDLDLVDIEGWKRKHPEHAEQVEQADELGDGISAGQRDS